MLNGAIPTNCSYTTNGQSPSDYYWRLKYVTLLSAAQAASNQVPTWSACSIRSSSRGTGRLIDQGACFVLRGATTTTKFS